MTRFVVDTNLYIKSYRDQAAAEDLERFYARSLPVSYLSSVVAQELLAGTRDRASVRELDSAYVAPFRRTRRIITPSHQAWARSGALIGELLATNVLSAPVPRSFPNDVLLALSCRESGCTLITENVRDFGWIRRLAPFSFVPPWPANSND